MSESTWEQPALKGVRPAEAGRTCKTCGAWKLAEEFALTPTGGLRRECRSCKSARYKRAPVETECAQCGTVFAGRKGTRYCGAQCRSTAARRATGVPPMNTVVDGKKACTKCGETKPTEEFAVGKGRAPGPWCRPCDRVHRRWLAETRRRRLTVGTGRTAPDGARVLDRQGYVREKRAGHHRASVKGWVFQHILVAEEKYGFAITYPAFTVHHRNGDRADNRPENLELRVGQHGYHGDVIPTLLRNPELRAIARAVLEQYDD